MSVSAYPLAWPDGLERTKRHATSKFKTTLTRALRNVEDSLRRFGDDSGQKISEIVISSNVTLGIMRPADSGVAVWFKWMDEHRCIAVDRYPKVEDNLQAIHHVLEARRTELRHGGLNIAAQTFRGFSVAALPAPAVANCWAELGIDPPGPDRVLTREDVQRAFKAKAATAHPDKGGMNADMASLIAARDAAMAHVE